MAEKKIKNNFNILKNHNKNSVDSINLKLAIIIVY